MIQMILGILLAQQSCHSVGHLFKCLEWCPLAWRHNMYMAARCKNIPSSMLLSGCLHCPDNSGSDLFLMPAPTKVHRHHFILRMYGRTLLYMTVCSCTRYSMWLHVAHNVHETYACILYACESCLGRPAIQHGLLGICGILQTSGRCVYWRWAAWLHTPAQSLSLQRKRMPSGRGWAGTRVSSCTDEEACSRFRI